MQSVLMEKLVEWKDDPNRKPLILQGIRQKSYRPNCHPAVYYQHKSPKGE